MPQLTNYDVLKQYKDYGFPSKVRDAWASLGSAIITPQSRTYVKDMIYLVQLSVPSPPSNFVVTPGNGQNTLSWDLVPDAVSYNVYWSTTPGVVLPESANKIVQLQPPFNHAGLINGTEYFYIVTAIAPTGESGQTSQMSGTPLTTVTTTPPAPTVTQVTPTDVNVTFTADVGATYNIYWSSTQPVTLLSTKISNVTSPVAINGLDASTTYYFVMTKTLSPGTESAPSLVTSYTTPASVQPPPYPPPPVPPLPPLPQFELEGALIYCEASLYSKDPLPWDSAFISDENQGFFCFNNNIITPHFRLLMTAQELLNVSAIETDFSFVPYSNDETSDINISDEELEIIMTEVGVPFFLYEELEFSRSKILNNMIKPAMQEYFKFFPISKPKLYTNISYVGYNQFEIPLPEGAYGALRAFVNQGSVGKGGAGSSPFFFYATEVAASGFGSSWSPNRNNSQNSPGYANLQGFSVMALDRAARQGMINYSTRIEFHIELKKDKQVLVGYSNKIGPVEIHWAMASNDWRAIHFDRLNDVRKLATAKVLRAFGMLRSQVKADLPGALDFSGFISRAKELEDGVDKSWAELPKVAVIRGAL